MFKIGDKVKLKKGVKLEDEFNGFKIGIRLIEAKTIVVNNVNKYGNYLEVKVSPYQTFQEWIVGLDAIKPIKRKRKNKKKFVRKEW